MLRITEEPLLTEMVQQTRSAKDVEIYHDAAPAVVLILTKDGLGSGSLIGKEGEILTNWHVVKGFNEVGVVLKPATEGEKPTQDDIKTAKVVRYDAVADLALVKMADPLIDRKPFRLADASEIRVGADVHAIGHPKGETWTYTKGIISQYRRDFEWSSSSDPNGVHQADVIQTQTPINPGNSGGPLITETGLLIGVNSFKGEGEGLNFAVSIDTIIPFLQRQTNRGFMVAGKETNKKAETKCEPRVLSASRNKKNDADVTVYDINCSGKANAEYMRADDPEQPYLFLIDRNDYMSP
jgi:S1-C subfamily serine protease